MCFINSKEHKSRSFVLSYTNLNRTEREGKENKRNGREGVEGQGRGGDGRG